MKLEEFIKKFICRNTLVRLWKESGVVHEMLGDWETEDFLYDNAVMEWEILNGQRMKKYVECEVVGITDIFCEKLPEAVNIVIKTN